MTIVILRRLFYYGLLNPISEYKKSSKKIPYIDVPFYHVTECNLNVIQKEIKGFLGELKEDNSRKIEAEIIDCFEKTELSGLFEKQSSCANNIFNFFWSLYQNINIKSIKELFLRLFLTDTKIPKTTNKRRAQILLYFHGGGYCSMESSGYRRFLSKVSKACNIKILAIDYRLAPKYPFPNALFDAVYTFLTITENKGSFRYSPEDVFIGGDSAGGGLSLALVCYLRDFGYKLPKGICLISPWVDLTLSTDSHKRNSDFDYLVLTTNRKADYRISTSYAGKESIENIYVSPIFNDLRYLPNTVIISGESECIIDESVKLNKEINNQINSSPSKIFVYKEMIHVFPIFTFSIYSKMAIENIADFIKETNNEEFEGSNEVIFI